MRSKSFYFLCCLILCSCTIQRDNKEISQSFMEKPSSVVIAQISGLEKPNYFKTGQQGILDVLINDTIGCELQQVISKIQLQPIVEKNYFEAFSQEFLTKNFEIKRADKILDRTQLPPCAEEKAELAPYNFQPLKEIYHVDYALIFDPQSCGLTRNYHGFIPLGEPRAWIMSKIYLVDLKDNKIVGFYNSHKEMAIEGDWDTPPDFKDTIKSIENNLIQVLNDGHIHFFGWHRS